MEPHKILIVDENLIRAQQIQQLLLSKNFTSEIIGTGDSALRHIQDNGYDLILTNLLLKDMDGVELVATIQQLQPELPVVIMSTPQHPSKTIKALYAGAHHFIREPFELKEVVDTIEKLLCYPKEKILMQKLLPFIDEQTEFNIPSDFSFMGAVVQYTCELVVRFDIVEPDNIHLKIALLEAITNAIEHGNKFSAKKTVRIQVKVNQEQATFTVKDQGPGFDYRNLPDPTKPENITKVRGRGVFMIYRIMDSVHFNEKGNEISMIKKRFPH
jgi:anti-sigma regulatory factor (Ser/Thr protein kinase)/ActR/RegA family two-component response regulator